MRTAVANGFTRLSDFAQVAFPDYPHVIGTLTDYPHACLQSFAQVTGKPYEAVRATTFAPVGAKVLSEVTSSTLSNLLKGSIARTVRYCPICLQDHPWYILPWRFSLLPGCPIHQCRLIDVCWHCHQPLPFLNNQMQITTCPLCGAPLSETPSQPLTPEEAQMTSRRWEELVFWLTPEDNPPDTAERRTRLGARLRALRTAYGVTQKDIAPLLQVDRMTLQGLETGEPIARQFEVTLVFAEAFGVSPRDMLCAEHAPTGHEPVGLLSTSESVPQLDLPEHDPALSRGEYLQQVMGQAVDYLHQAGYPVTQEAVAECIRVSVPTLRRYPESRAVLKTIAQANEASRPQRQNAEEILAKVNEAIKTLEAQNQPMTRAAIAAIIGVHPTSLSHYPDVKAVVERVSEHHKSQKDMEAQQEEDRLLDLARDAVARLKANNEPVTKKAISRLVGVNRMKLDFYPRVRLAVDHWREERSQHPEFTYTRLEDKLAHIETYLVLEVRRAIQQLREQGKSIHPTPICKTLGMASPIVMAYPEVRRVVAEAMQEDTQEPPGDAQHRDTAQQREAALLAQARTIVDHAWAHNERVAKLGIARQLGYSLWTIRQQYPQIVAFLDEVIAVQRKRGTEAQRAYEEQLVAHVQQARAVLQAEGGNVTQHIISDRIGVPVHELTKYAPIRDIFDEIKQDRIVQGQQWQQSLIDQIPEAAQQVMARGEQLTHAALYRELAIPRDEYRRLDQTIIKSIVEPLQDEQRRSTDAT